MEGFGCVPDICSPLIGHGWARVPPQIQCTITSAAEEDKKAKVKSGQGEEKRQGKRLIDHTESNLVSGREQSSDRGWQPDP